MRAKQLMDLGQKGVVLKDSATKVQNRLEVRGAKRSLYLSILNMGDKMALFYVTENHLGERKNLIT